MESEENAAALAKLAMAMGNPALEARGDETLAGALVAEAVRRMSNSACKSCHGTGHTASKVVDTAPWNGDNLCPRCSGMGRP